MTRFYMGALMLSASLSLEAAPCIQLDNENFQLNDNEIGSAVVNWRVDLKNECRKTLDADMTVKLLDEDGEAVHEFPETATLGLEESIEVEREVYVPSRIVGTVEDFSIDLEERERQY